MVFKDKCYTTGITGITNEGLGVGSVNGFVVFVEGALPGEEVLVQISQVKKSYAKGKVVEILKDSPERIKPFCSVYERCGGCSLQHLDYDAQLRAKTGFVKDNLTRIGKLPDVTVNSTIGMENPFNYRNNVQLPVRKDTSNSSIGFFAIKSHEIIEGSECGIQHKIGNSIRNIVSNFLVNNGISAYDEQTGKGNVRHLVVRSAFCTGETMVVIVINERKLPEKEKLINALTSEFPEIKGIMLNINTKRTNAVLGSEYISIYGKNTITDYIGDFKFQISPVSFFQINPVQTEVLYKKALEYACLSGNEIVFDLYCGIGTISLFLSQKAKMVYGVEVVPDAVKDAQKNAKINGVSNVEFRIGKAEVVIPKMYHQGIRADVVVVDPPRKGCDERLLQTITEMAPKRMVYVSCNPATLARDLKYLSEHGMTVEEVQPVDMFPWTGHVECVILMQRSGLEDEK